MILRSKHLKPCFGFVKEEVLRVLLSVIVVSILAFLSLLSGSGSETELQEPSPIDVTFQGVRSELRAPRVFFGGAETARATAVLNQGNTGLPEVLDSAFSKKCSGTNATVARATATVRLRMRMLVREHWLARV